MSRTLTMLCAVAVCTAAPAQSEGLSHLPLLSEVAPDTVAISPHVPQMGAHWANPANLPLGPIYCEIEGRVVCVEYLFAASDLAEGMSWREIAPGIETPPITRIDMDFIPEGIPPMPVPLYQLHIYFAETGVLAAH